MLFNFLAFITWFAIFSVFLLSFLFYKNRSEWRSAGILEGFLIALFLEMFGIPLSIYLLSGLLGVSDISGLNNLRVDLLGREPIQLIFIVPIILLEIAGFVLIYLGWHRIYKSQNSLITDGIYNYLRHPQYLGLILITLGLLIWWPTVVTLIMWPVLCLMYFMLAKREEKHMLAVFGEEYSTYMKRVNMFIPLIRKRN
jgi:protein-S-isoprenylcysteine O-methyltransferase Ste14